MRDKIELYGMVLSSMPVGDYDKRLVLLTKERGKITAFARGARKPNSPYLGLSEPFNFGTFVLMEGFDAYRLVGGEIKEYFLDIKNDIEGICYGTYFCDILEYLCVDEPFSALDYQTRLNVCDDIGKIIKKEGKTAILVTHDISEAISMADRVIVLAARPAYVKKKIPIRFAMEERTPMKARSAPEFKTYFNAIWKELNENA